MGNHVPDPDQMSIVTLIGEEVGTPIGHEKSLARRDFARFEKHPAVHAAAKLQYVELEGSRFEVEMVMRETRKDAY